MRGKDVMRAILANKVSLTAEDDAGLLLIGAILRDAAEWRYDETRACPGCLAVNDICCAHWNTHGELARKYRDLRTSLEGYDGLGIRYPLTMQEQDIIESALNDALLYRSETKTIEGTALIAAYREVAKGLGIISAA